MTSVLVSPEVRQIYLDTEIWHVEINLTAHHTSRLSPSYSDSFMARLKTFQPPLVGISTYAGQRVVLKNAAKLYPKSTTFCFVPGSVELLVFYHLYLDLRRYLHISLAISNTFHQGRQPPGHDHSW